MGQVFDWFLPEHAVRDVDGRLVRSVWIVRREESNLDWRARRDFVLLRPLKTGLVDGSLELGNWCAFGFLCCRFWNICEQAARELGRPPDTDPAELAKELVGQGKMIQARAIENALKQEATTHLPEPLGRPLPRLPYPFEDTSGTLTDIA